MLTSKLKNLINDFKIWHTFFCVSLVYRFALHSWNILMVISIWCTDPQFQICWWLCFEGESVFLSRQSQMYHAIFSTLLLFLYRSSVSKTRARPREDFVWLCIPRILQELLQSALFKLIILISAEWLGSGHPMIHVTSKHLKEQLTAIRLSLGDAHFIVPRSF